MLRNNPINNGLPSPSMMTYDRELRNMLPLEQSSYKVKDYDLEEISERIDSRQPREKYYHDRKSGIERASLVEGRK